MCVPVTHKYYCRNCRKYFTKTIGDAISIPMLQIRCRWCRSDNVRIADGETILDSVLRLLSTKK